MPLTNTALRGSGALLAVGFLSPKAGRAIRSGLRRKRPVPPPLILEDGDEEEAHSEEAAQLLEAEVLELNIFGLSGYLGTVRLSLGGQAGTATSLATVKASIEQEVGIPVLAQRLLYGVQELREESNFAELLDGLCLDAGGGRSGCGCTLDLVVVRRSAEQVACLEEFRALSWTQVPGWLAQASEEARADREIVLAAVSRTGGALKYASVELRSDREFVLEAVARCHSGAALFQATPAFRDDEELVLAAVAQNPSALKFASERLRRDRAFLLRAMRRNGYVLQFVPERFRQDRELVAAAVGSRGPALRFAPRELQGDPQLAKLASHTGLEASALQPRLGSRAVAVGGA